MADDKLREAALKPIATIKKPVIAADKKEETKAAEETKETAKKAATTKKTATKKAATKTAAKAAETKAEEPKAEETKKATAKKATTKETAKETATKEEAKKAPAKKTATAKKTTAKADKEEVKSMIVLQYADREVTYSTIVDKAKDAFVNGMGGKETDIKTFDLYVKPEENTVYFVVNGEINGQCQI